MTQTEVINILKKYKNYLFLSEDFRDLFGKRVSSKLLESMRKYDEIGFFVVNSKEDLYRIVKTKKLKLFTPIEKISNHVFCRSFYIYFLK